MLFNREINDLKDKKKEQDKQIEQLKEFLLKLRDAGDIDELLKDIDNFAKGEDVKGGYK